MVSTNMLLIILVRHSHTVSVSEVLEPSYDPPTGIASTNAPLHLHNAYAQYVEHSSLSHWPIMFGVFTRKATGGVVKGRLVKREVLLGGNENSKRQLASTYTT